MCANCLECIILQLAQQEDDPHVLQRLLVPGPGASDCISGGCVVDPTADNEEEVGHIRPLATDLWLYEGCNLVRTDQGARVAGLVGGPHEGYLCWLGFV